MFSLLAKQKNNLFKPLALFLVSFFIVAWGHPDVSVLLSIISYGCGLALFWVFLFHLSSKKQRFWVASLWFAAVQAVQLSWLATPTYQGIYIYFVYAGLVMLLGLQWGFFSLFFPKKCSFKWRQLLALAGIWTLFEWVRLYFLCGFVWNPLGLTMTAYPALAQLASVGGVFFLSFWTCLVNLLVCAALIKRRWKPIGWAHAAFFFPFLFGMIHLYYHEKQSNTGIDTYRIALVQTALLPDQKMFFYDRGGAFVHPVDQWRAIFSYLENQGEKPFDLIVLPESVVPFSAKNTIYNYADVQDVLNDLLGSKDFSYLLKWPFAKKDEFRWFVTNLFWAQALADYHDAEVVLGLDDTDEESLSHYNAAFHLTPHESEVGRYEKRVLLPLAEYLPFPFLEPLVARYGVSGFFTPGKTAKIFGSQFPLTISICYEECFSHLIRDGKLRGARLFVNVSNDAWYPSSRLHLKHFIHGRVRAIENGVPLVRACNTGVTAAVDSLGKTVAQLGKKNLEQERGALIVTLPLYTYQTLYTYVGDYFIVVVALFFICVSRVPTCRKST